VIICPFSMKYMLVAKGKYWRKVVMGRVPENTGMVKEISDFLDETRILKVFNGRNGLASADSEELVNSDFSSCLSSAFI